jgi:hypothetical protein
MSLSCFVFWQRINGMAQVQKAKLAKVNMDYVLGVGGFDLERFVSLKIPSLVELYSMILDLS